MRSHLLKTTTTPLPASWIMPAILLSWVTEPVEASTMNTATSHCSRARIVRMLLKTSTASLTLDLRRRPAVSIRRMVLPCHLRSVWTESRVVPEISLTRASLRPVRMFSSDDLPTLGRPRMATRQSQGSSTSCFGKPSTTTSSRSPTP